MRSGFSDELRQQLGLDEDVPSYQQTTRPFGRPQTQSRQSNIITFGLVAALALVIVGGAVLLPRLLSQEGATTAGPVAVTSTATHTSTPTTTAEATPTLEPTEATQLPSPTADISGCGMPSRLMIGDYITTAPGAPDDIYTETDTASAEIGILQTGSVTQVEEGPFCEGGRLWWRIDSGWIVEGINRAYWLVPLAGPPSENECPLEPRLSAGDTAVVVPGPSNRMRSGPGSERYDVVGSIPENKIFTILGQSICGENGLVWYPINYDGIFGWTAEGDDGEYWIAPADD